MFINIAKKDDHNLTTFIIQDFLPGIYLSENNAFTTFQ